jgi:hypothetical protein
VKLVFSNDFGQTWSSPKTLSKGGDNYFPTLDVAGKELAVAWYTNRFDPNFHNRQDVELVTTNLSGKVLRRQRITPVSNETEADPLLGGTFIGDYIEVTAAFGHAWVGYNANYRKAELAIPFSVVGAAVNQQDNYLTKRGL